MVSTATAKSKNSKAQKGKGKGKGKGKKSNAKGQDDFDAILESFKQEVRISDEKESSAASQKNPNAQGSGSTTVK
ncbi:hypothetical protein IWQ62_005355, partial [Dispira parvispora]